ncbi:MAG: hypothetical protein WB528_12590, partial [Bradyrhizobium sp.]
CTVSVLLVQLAKLLNHLGAGATGYLLANPVAELVVSPGDRTPPPVSIPETESSPLPRRLITPPPLQASPPSGAGAPPGPQATHGRRAGG